MSKENQSLTTGRKWRITLALILCMAVVGTAIGFCIVIFQPSEAIDVNKDSYVVADNGYSGNSEQKMLQPLQSEEYTAAVNEKVQDSVVTIVTERVTNILWTYTQTSTGLGTGVIYQIDDEKVYVVTNAHVISEAQNIYLYCNEDVQIPAALQGMDEQSDIAVIVINTADIPDEILKNMQVITWGDSDAVRVGDPGIAIGCPFGLEFGNSVTMGIISATERQISYDGITINVMQTDAAINPGNSGGALVDKNGELIGINTAKIQIDSVEGMGFAIPSNTVKPIVDAIMNDGSVSHPELGVSYYDFITEAIADIYHIPTGVIIYEIERGSEGWKAGLQVGDIITDIDGVKLESLEDVSEILNSHEAGDIVEITVVRNRNEQEPIKLQLQLSNAESEEQQDFWGHTE